MEDLIIEAYFITDIKGRIIEVEIYQSGLVRRSFQDKNLLNSVTLHKEMNNVKI